MQTIISRLMYQNYAKKKSLTCKMLDKLLNPISLFLGLLLTSVNLVLDFPKTARCIQLHLI